MIAISIPALRDRPEDIQALAAHFLIRYSREMNKPVKNFTPEALRLLSAYSWPGNVRELKNVVERAVVICRSTVLGVPELVFLQPGKEGESRGLTLQEVELEHLRRIIAASDVEYQSGG